MNANNLIKSRLTEINYYLSLILTFGLIRTFIIIPIQFLSLNYENRFTHIIFYYFQQLL